ncbi:hypothetical protein M9Y10_004739 [Tritrichomonas musculus]|uniref:Uncharacterized protein n=1 Tax=Tritrichomonas musculus TaxID=1915356 RepID=A0ABR2JKJ8_9EUKA
MIKYKANKYSKPELGNQKKMTTSKRLQKNVEVIDALIKALGITIKPFISQLKDHSKKSLAPNAISPGHVLREEVLALTIDLKEKSNIDKEIKLNDIGRITYPIMNSIISIIAAESPEVVQAIANNSFQDLPFKEKLMQRDHLAQKWSQYIDEIQLLKQQLPINQASTFDLTPLDNLTLLDSTPDNLTLFDSTPDNLTLLDSTPDNLTLLDSTPDNLTLLDSTPDNLTLLDSTPEDYLFPDFNNWDSNNNQLLDPSGGYIDF